MILWFKNLPKKDINFSKWKPFIKNTWFRKNYMKFVYWLIGLLFISCNFLVSNLYIQQLKNIFANYIDNSAIVSLISLLCIVFIISAIFILHELLHIIVVYNKDDISLTVSGIFFWLNTNAILSKMHFWLFMTLPIIVLSLIPFIASILVSGYIKSLMAFTC